MFDLNANARIREKFIVISLISALVFLPLCNAFAQSNIDSSAMTRVAATNSTVNQNSIQESGVSKTEIDDLTDLVVKTLPAGYIFDTLKKEDPYFPLWENNNKATPLQLTCIRSELNTSKFREYRFNQVASYLKQNHTLLNDDIKVLKLVSPIYAAALETRKENGEFPKELKIKPLIAGIPTEQLDALIDFTVSPKFRELRNLIGISDMDSFLRVYVTEIVFMTMYKKAFRTCNVQFFDNM